MVGPDDLQHFFSDEIQGIILLQPHEILIPMKWWKISALARLRARARKLCISRKADFGQVKERMLPSSIIEQAQIWKGLFFQYTWF